MENLSISKKAIILALTGTMMLTCTGCNTNTKKPNIDTFYTTEESFVRSYGSDYGKIIFILKENSIVRVMNYNSGNEYNQIVGYGEKAFIETDNLTKDEPEEIETQGVMKLN